MLYSAQEMKSLHFQVLINEVRYIKRILSFFDFEICHIAVSLLSKEQIVWIDIFTTLEDLEALEESLLVLKFQAKNIHDEIKFLESLKNEKHL